MKQAWRQTITRATTEQKDAALLHLAELLAAPMRYGERLDVSGTTAGLSPAMLDRLTLNPARLDGMAGDPPGSSLPDGGEPFDVVSQRLACSQAASPDRCVRGDLRSAAECHG
jgi:hypothetical protein